MLRKLMTMILIGAMTLGTLTACGARRDTPQSAPAVQGTAPGSEALSAQAEQQLDELIATLEAEGTPEELQGFVP
ncbi:MAG: hypothetical protein ACT4QE_04350 [Anaerolineales bacterium]